MIVKDREIFPPVFSIYKQYKNMINAGLYAALHDDFRTESMTA